jgi:hypothetical protein
MRDRGAYTLVQGKVIIRYVLTFVRSGLEMDQTHPCEETFVLGSGSTRYKCHYLYWGQKQIKRDGDKYRIL